VHTLLRDLQQPEWVHVLINPLPVYGLAIGVVALIVSFFVSSRSAQIVALILILITAASAWPVIYFGEGAYDRVLSMADSDGEAWLKVHEARAEKLAYVYYATAVIAAVALLLPRKWPRSTVPLLLATLILALVSLGAGGYIAYAGGKIRHREFRSKPPPPLNQSS